MVHLKLMPPLTRMVGEKEVAVDVGRASLRAVFERAAAGNAKFRAALLDAEGNLSAEYSCLVNGRRHNVSDLDGVVVDEHDEIVVLMPIAGGASFLLLWPPHPSLSPGGARGTFPAPSPLTGEGGGEGAWKPSCPSKCW